MKIEKKILILLEIVDSYLFPRNYHSSLPSEDVRIEAEVVGGDVDPAMHEDVFLESAGVVTHQHFVGGNARKVFTEIIAPLTVVGAEGRGHP